MLFSNDSVGLNDSTSWSVSTWSSLLPNSEAEGKGFTSGVTTETLPPGRPPPHNTVVETVTATVLWVLALAGNILVCLVIYRSRRLQSTTNYFVVSLAAADLIMTLICIPFIAGAVIAKGWVFGTVVCKIIRYLQWLVPGTCMFVFISICVDRFYTIIYPLSFKVTRSTAKRLISVSWVASMLIATPSFYFYEASIKNGIETCRTFLPSTWDGILFMIVLFLLTFVVPTVCLAIGYSRIFRYLWVAGIGGRTFQRTQNPVPRAKVKMVKMIIVVNISNILLLAPFFIVQFCISVSGVVVEEVDPRWYIAITWISFSTAVSRPVIYMCYNSNFRRGCREVFCMSSMKCYRSSAYTITSMSKFAKKNHVGIMDPFYSPRDYRDVESPSTTFNRSAMLEKCTWPLANSEMAPSTYV